MNGKYPLVELGEVLSLYQDYINAPEPREYPKLSVKLYGRGVVMDAPADGANLKMQRHQLAKAGQVILSEIWGKKGAIGIVPPEGEGALCTSHFFLFDIRRDRLEPKYLQAIFTANYLQDQLDAGAQGTTGYAAVRPKHLLSATIPLPPLAEQRRIVARIDALAARIEAARGLRRAAAGEVEALWRSSLRALESRGDAPVHTLEYVCAEIIDNLHSTPVYDGSEYACIRSQDIGWGTINYGTALKTSEREFLHRIQRGEPKAGDIVYVREGDVGRCAVVDGSQRFCLGQRVMMFRPKSEFIGSRYLLYQLLSPTVLDDQVRSGKTGTTSHHVNISHLRRIKLNVPPLPEQRRIVAYLDDLQARVDGVKRLQAETQAELDALLPALLDKAFKGEL